MSNPGISPLPLVLHRAAHLRKGINLSHWFSQIYTADGYTPRHFETYITDADLKLVAKMGFDHVRFPINPEPMLDAKDPARLPAEYVARLDRAVRTMHDLGLAVIIDLHPEAPFKKWLAASEGNIAAFVAFWGALAGHFSTFDVDRTFFEVLNEPEVQDPKLWNSIQNRAAAAIRRAASEHTLILSGDEWSALPMLELIEPPADRNIIGNFHLYDPLVFTHQGAGWAPPYAMFCKGLTYPSDPVFIDKFLGKVRDPEAIRRIAEYRDEGWNPARYEQMIQRGVAWGREHGVALTCNEFGVYKDFAPRADRLRWLSDLSGLLQKHGIGWSLWDYAGSFAVVKCARGKREPDVEVCAALGLKPR